MRKYVMAWIVIGLLIATWAGQVQGIAPSSEDPICPSSMDRTICDAELLALELSGALLPPSKLYEQVVNDLTAIRQAYPDMNEIYHRPSWIPGELIVGFTQEAWQQIQDGEYDGLDKLNSDYGPVEMRESSTQMLLKFDQRYNPEYLAPLYTVAKGVTGAEPNQFIANNSDIQASLPDYTFKLAWGDCLSGCIYAHYWQFTVIDGSVTLVSEYGDALPKPEPTLQLYLPMVIN